MKKIYIAELHEYLPVLHVKTQQQFEHEQKHMQPQGDEKGAILHRTLAFHPAKGGGGEFIRKRLFIYDLRIK